MHCILGQELLPQNFVVRNVKTQVLTVLPLRILFVLEVYVYTFNSVVILLLEPKLMRKNLCTSHDLRSMKGKIWNAKDHLMLFE